MQDETTTVAVNETTTAEPVVETTTAMDEETTEAAEEPAAGQQASFNVSNLSAPLTANVSETITVTATVTNPTDAEATQPVEFRLDGDVVERQDVTLGAGESQNATFEIDTTDVAAGLHVLAVQTRDFGQVGQITLLRQPETTTEGANETTTEGINETTTEVVETTTEEEVETTTEVEETTTEPVVETTTEPVVETTTEPAVETTTEPAVETTTEPAVEGPEQVEQFVFSVERVQIDNWSFVVGDELEPDRTQVIEDITISDRTQRINLTRMLMENETAEEVLNRSEQETLTPMATTTPELPEDIPTVRYVLQDITIENVTFIVELPSIAEIMPETPVPTETPEPVETTTEPAVETTTEPVETTTEPAVETTTEPVETTTEPVETTTEPVETTTEPADETTTEEVIGPGALSFNVSSLSAPETAEIGETLTVTANVTNPNDEQARQEVEFRISGDLVESRNVTLDAGESQDVTFEVDTTDVAAGTYIHGVLTDEFGELAVITLEESATETTEVVETTTAPALDGTTTVAAGNTTTEAVVGTTTEGAVGNTTTAGEVDDTTTDGEV